jgi:hypothetical protein
MQQRLAALSDTCRTRGIKIVEEDRLPGGTFWRSVSSAFIKMSEEWKAEVSKSAEAKVGRDGLMG